jgi:UDP-N-acetylglucosamine:LPS N-acetylglucosamine transferase
MIWPAAIIGCDLEKKKKILIITTSAGSGHVATARAISSAIERCHPGRFNVVLADVFTDIKFSAPIGQIAIPFYSSSVKLLNAYPYKLFFKLSDATPRLINQFFTTIFKDLGREYLLEEDPDIIVTTFPIIGYAASRIVAAGWHKDVPTITVVTDAGDVHSLWLTGNETAVLVSTPETIEYAAQFGVPRESMHYLGFPLDHRLSELPAKTAAREHLGLDPNLPTVLFTCGGLGMGNKMKALARHLTSHSYAAQFLFVAGKNFELRRELEAMDFKNPVIIYGYVDNMPELLAASDLVVSKAGWITLYEAMVAHCPLLIIDVVPGQEEPNADFVQRHGVGIVQKKARLAAKLIGEFVNDTALLEPYRKALDDLCLDPSADSKVAQFIVDTLEKGVTS